MTNVKSKRYVHELVNNGEALSVSMLMNMQHRAQDELRERVVPPIGDIGGALKMGLAGEDTISLFYGNDGNAGLDEGWMVDPLQPGFANAVFIPSPGDMPRLRQSPTYLRWHTIAGQSLVMRRSNSTGTFPGASSGRTASEVARRLVASTDPANADLLAEEILPASNPTVNPKYTCIDVRLNAEDAANSSVDFEDAVTRAKSTQSFNKERAIWFETAQTDGAEAASPALPAVASGWGRLIAVKRNVGQAFPVPTSQIEFHAYPMRLAREIQRGAEGFPQTADWAPSISAMVKSTTDNDYVLYFPRNMHPGCRLVGFGMTCGSTFANDITVELGSFNHAGTFTVLQSFLLGTSNGLGVYGRGVTDFSTPIWGNGLPSGPLQDPDRGALDGDGVSPVSLINRTQLALRVGATGNTTQSGDTIGSVEFIYLY